MKNFLLSLLTLTAFAANAGTTGAPNLVIVEQSDTTIFCDEGTRIYVALQNFNGPITVSWKFNDVVDTTYTQEQGNTYISYQPTQEGVYTCEIFDDFGGSVLSAPIVTIRSNIYDLFIVENDDVLSLSETPDSIPYMQIVINWYKDGEQIGSGPTVNVQGLGNYTAALYYAYKGALCQVTTEPFIATSVEDIAVANSISLFPNPANNVVTISSTMPVLTADVYDATGRLVLSNRAESANNITLAVANLTNGIYSIKLTHTNGLVAVKKLIKY